jgi:hypothetical protein
MDAFYKHRDNEKNIATKKHRSTGKQANGDAERGAQKRRSTWIQSKKTQKSRTQKY